jgi:hypothetical protein
MKITVTTVETSVWGKKIIKTASAEVPDPFGLMGEEDCQQIEIRKTLETLLEALNKK